MPREDEQLLTLEEVVAYLRVNERTVYRLIHSGEIPALRVGRQWRVRRSALDTWLQGTVRDRDQAEAPAGPLPPPTQKPGPHRVLVVDDDAAVCELLQYALGRPTYETDAVPDGQTAIDRLQVERYDLMIVDLRMPGADGMDVIRAGKRLVPSLPAIIITGYASKASAIDAVNLGVKAYLTKPFRVREVVETVARVLDE